MSSIKNISEFHRHERRRIEKIQPYVNGGEEMVVDAAGILAWTLRENADFLKCLYLLMMKIY
jgi:hypothetical protein